MKNKFFFYLICFLSLFFSFGGYSEEKDYKSFNTSNPYKVLGIEKTADETEIRSAWRKLVKKYHPDRNPGDKEAENKFKDIGNAYETLIDGSSSSLGGSANNSGGIFSTIFNGPKQLDPNNQDGRAIENGKVIKEFRKFSFFKKETSKFLETEARYINLLKKQQNGETLSKSEEKELKDYRVENLKDLEVFKRVLSHLGLPHGILHPVLLQTYLDNLKNKVKNFQLKDLKQVSGTRSSFQGERKSNLEAALHEIDLIKDLRTIKTTLDTFQHNSLEEGAKILKGNFMKNFGAQFIIFHAAFGFSIYMKALYDKKITGYEKNPEELMEAARQSLTPSGILSFFVFVAVASKVQYRIYGLGRFLDEKTTGLGKSWNGGLARSLSPSLGLGAGFLFYSIFYELLNDPDLELCVKEHFKKEGESMDSLIEDHISPCEQFYMNWQAGEKWKILGVDIVSIMGSGVISHKITSSIFRHLSRTMIGHSLMALAMKKLGPKLIRGGNLFINLVLFIEVHKVLEKWAGKPVKEQFLAGGVNAEVSNLSDGIEYIDDFIKPEFWTQDLKESAKSDNGVLFTNKSFFPPFEDESALFFQQEGQDRSSLFFNQTIDSIQFLGNRFRIWTEFVNQDYNASYSYWTEKLNKRLINYETSLGLLDRLFILSQLDYNTMTEKLIYEEFISDYNFSYKFQKDILFEAKDHYCSLVHEEFHEELVKCLGNDECKLPLWTDLCENDKDEFYYHSKKMIYETSYLIHDLLSKSEKLGLTLNGEKLDRPDNNFEVESWISLKKDEVFSSDPNFSIQNFVTENSQIDYDKRISLAKQFIKKGLELKNTNQKELSLKFLTAGIYILRDFLKISESRHNLLSVYNGVLFEKVKRLIRLIETHKKGERAFLEYVEARESAKNLFSKAIDQIPGINRLREKGGNHYFIFYNLICSSPNKVDLDYFSIPQLLSDFDDIELYDFKKKEYEPLSSLCSEPLSSLVSLSYSKEEAIHKFLFETPARYKGAEYENLYLSVEHIVGSKYKVFDKNLENIVKSEEKTNLMNMYHGKESISGQLKALSETNLSEIQLLMDQFYRKTINEESNITYYYDENCNVFSQDKVDKVISEECEVINQELLDYYDQNKVYFNFCSLSSDLSFGGSEKLTGGCEGGFKNIEVSIFQVNYLLKNLKKLLIKGDEIKVCEEGENCQTLNDKFLFGLDEEDNKEGGKKDNKKDNKEGGKKDNKKDNKEGGKRVNFDIMHSQVITELQVIHDCYKTVNENETGNERCFQENLAASLMDFMQTNLDFWLKTFLMDNNYAFRYDSHWEKIVYSILFELNKSLNNFNGQLLPLTLKRNFEQRSKALSLE